MNSLHPDQIAALSRIPSLKGGALSLVVVMLIAQQPLMAHELQTFSGLANGAVTAGLRTLTTLKAVINLGRRGWVLSPNWQQLTIPLQFLGDNVNHENRDCPRELSFVNHENRDYPTPLVVSLVSNDPKEEDNQLTKLRGPVNHENRDLPSTGEDFDDTNSVAYWLKKAGVIPGSKQMTLLVEKIKSPQYAKAHALQHLHERRVWEKAGKSSREPETGALIYRLHKGLAAPSMRCEECLNLERDCHCRGRESRQHIPNEYLDVISR